MSSGSESESSDVLWEEAEDATRALREDHDSYVERTLADDPWDTTIALLQLGRSTGWDCHFLMLAVRQMIRLVVAAAIQWTIMRYFGYSLMTMTPYGGQPWLCNMGKDFQHCDGEFGNAAGPDCMGPGGTRYTKSDLYSDFGVWSTRVFARDSFLSVFDNDPAMQQKINANVDPGEWGLESNICRYMCLLLFAIQIQQEFREITDSFVLISWLKCNDDPWLTTEGKGKNQSAKFIHGGMPCCWKLISYMIVFFRLMICLFTGILGTRFLLDTAAITDLIFNSLALTFIFDLDVLIQNAWATPEPQKYMDSLEPLRESRDHCFTKMKDCLHNYLPIPVEMIGAIFIMAIWCAYIFYQSCEVSDLGGVASGAVYAVEYGHYSVFPWLWKTTRETLHPLTGQIVGAQWCPPAALVANSTCTLR